MVLKIRMKSGEVQQMNMTKKHIKLQRYQIYASYSKHWLSWKQIRNAHSNRLTPAELNYLLCDNWFQNL